MDDIDGTDDRPVSFRDLLSLSLDCEEQRPLLKLLPHHQAVCLRPDDVSLPRLPFPEIQAFRSPSVINLHGGGGDIEMRVKWSKQENGSYGYRNDNYISDRDICFRHTPDLRLPGSLQSLLFPEFLPFWSSNAASSVTNLCGSGVVSEVKGPKQENSSYGSNNGCAVSAGDFGSRLPPDLRSEESLPPLLFPEIMPLRSCKAVPAASAGMNPYGGGLNMAVKSPKRENRYFGYKAGDFGFRHLPDLRFLGNKPPVPVNSHFGSRPRRCIFQNEMTGNHLKAAYPFRPCEKSMAARLKTKKASRSSELARERRRKWREKIRDLQELMPWETKMDTAKMLGEAYKYVKFLQAQATVLESMPVRGDLPSHHQENPSPGVPGPLAELSGRELLEAAVNSPAVQRFLYSEGYCICSSEQVAQLAERLGSA
ncbi:unnamed protein product [Cuscuta campestris]|uniref:BHLH domain-containing protein n=1 Tax=Cuscuta campestris TaxID=132261 RepID=A0A484MZT6_9ASTE|nr:unnamed protein product [Cuscuta campestris]